MRNKYILFSASAVFLFGLAAFGFAGNNGDDDKKKKKTEKKIEVTDKNGEKTVTIETTENGKTKKEIYTGKEADEYLKKNENGVHVNSTFNKIIRIDIDANDDSSTGDEKDVFMFYNSDDSVFNKEELNKEIEKIKKELEESGIHFDFDMNLNEECLKNMQNKCMAYAYSFDEGEMEMHIDSMMKSMDIDISISDEDKKAEKKLLSAK